jgi:hypothetical protein
MSLISIQMKRFTSPCLSVTEDPETKLWKPTEGHDQVVLSAYDKPLIYTIEELDDLLKWASAHGYWLETCFLDNEEIANELDN